MATIDVKDAAGATVAIEKPLVPGRTAAATSRPVALSNEDFAVLDGLETAIASTNTKLNGGLPAALSAGGGLKATLLDGANSLVLSGATMTTAQTTVTTTATSIFATNASRVFAEVTNLHATLDLFLGQTSGVTTANGYRLRPGNSFSFEGYTGPVFAIVASSTAILAEVEW